MTSDNPAAVIGCHLRRHQLVPTAVLPKLKPLPGIRAVLFDIYGTLIIADDSAADFPDRLSPSVYDLLANLIAEFKWATTPGALITAFRTAIRDHHHRVRQVNSFPEVNVLHIWRNLLPDAEPDRLRAFALAFEMVMHPAGPAGDLGHLFGALRQKGIVCGVISNAQFYTRHLLEYFLGQSLTSAGFEQGLLLWSYRYRTAKPSPRLFGKAVQKLSVRHLEPSQVLFVGNDPVNDLEPARQAGFVTGLFCGDRRSAPSPAVVTEARADVILTDWNQLPGLLDWYPSTAVEGHLPIR